MLPLPTYCLATDLSISSIEKPYRCEYENGQSRMVFVRIDCLLVLIHELLENDMSVNIRWIPYAFPEVFKNTTDVERPLEIICKGIGCTRDSLNIFASAKGRIAGDIRFKTTKKGSFSTYCEAGVSIEPRAVAGDLEIESLITEEPLLILVVEKISIFEILVNERIHKRFRCIIITGSGMPDVATRTLLRKTQERFGIPVVAITDHNAGGFEIYLTYLCGSENMAYEDLSTPDIKWLGLSPSDLIEHNIPEGKQKVGTRQLDTIKKKQFVKNSRELAEEVKQMKTKVDLESLVKNGVKYVTEIYLPLKFQQLINGYTYRSEFLS